MISLTVLDLLDTPSLDETDVEQLAHDLATVRVRDAVLAHAVGHAACARQILDGHAPPARWLVTGPIDPTQAEAFRPLLARVHQAAALEGGEPSWAAATIGAYLDWATGHRIAAVRRLRNIPTTYTFAQLLRTMIASSQPLPEARPHGCCTWRTQ